MAEIERQESSTYTALFTTRAVFNGKMKDLEITVFHPDRYRKEAEINASSFSGGVDSARDYVRLYETAIVEAERVMAKKRAQS